MSKKEEETTLKPKVADDDLLEMLQALADKGEIKTAAGGLKVVRANGHRVAQKRVYEAFSSVVIPEPEVTETDETEAAEEPAEAPAAEETEDWADDESDNDE